MSTIKLSTAIAGFVLAGLGGLMVASNPSREAYETYAAEKLSTYVKDKGCNEMVQKEVPRQIAEVVTNNCIAIIDKNRSQIQEIIANNTKRQNLLFLSIYRTDLSLPAALPDYHFETVGLLQNFYIYQTKKS
ncbi:MAG: DUF4359 domain-containing protein [Prochloraceae cyanobacterium]